jgi:hypothetical protein
MHIFNFAIPQGFSFVLVMYCHVINYSKLGYFKTMYIYYLAACWKSRDNFTGGLITASDKDSQVIHQVGFSSR